MNKSFFPITHLHRDDLRAVGFDGDGVGDDAMEYLARKLGEAYVGSDGFWIDLKILAEEMNVPHL